MRYVWDERKRLANLKKHGLDFADAWKVFAGAMVLFEDDRERYASSDCSASVNWMYWWSWLSMWSATVRSA